MAGEEGARLTQAGTEPLSSHDRGIGPRVSAVAQTPVATFTDPPVAGRGAGQATRACTTAYPPATVRPCAVDSNGCYEPSAPTRSGTTTSRSPSCEDTLPDHHESLPRLGAPGSSCECNHRDVAAPGTVGAHLSTDASVLRPLYPGAALDEGDLQMSFPTLDALGQGRGGRMGRPVVPGRTEIASAGTLSTSYRGLGRPGPAIPVRSQAISSR